MVDNILHGADRLTEYIKMFGKVSEPQLGENDKLLMSSVNELNRILMRYSTPQANGDYPQINTQDLYKLQLNYDIAIATAVVVMSKENPNSVQKRFQVIARQIYDLLIQDNYIIHDLRPIPGMVLPAMVRNARSKILRLNNEELSTVGAVNSTRIPIEYIDESGNTQRGFFTEGHNVTTDINAALSMFAKRQLERGTRYPNVYKKIMGLENAGSFSNANLNHSNPQTALRALDLVLNSLNILDDEKQLYMENDDFIAEIKSFSSRFKKYQTLCEKYSSANTNATSGSGIETRNNAMYDVAGLIGATNIIAKSESMIVEINGKKVCGTFMVAAQGSDMEHPAKDDPMVRWQLNGDTNSGTTTYDVSPEAIKQLMQMDALDYICGNSDRHPGNMFYKFDTSDPMRPVLIGITGIDNDQSFEKNPATSPYFTQAKEIRFLDRITAQKICELTKEQLTLTLNGQELGENEINEAWVRCQEIQTLIAQGMQDYTDEDDLYTRKSTPSIRVLSDEQIKQLDYNRLLSLSSGFCGITKVNMAGSGIVVRHQELSRANSSSENRELTYNHAEIIRNPHTDSVETSRARFNTWDEILRSNDPLLHINSKVYKNMKAAAEDIRNALTLGVADEETLVPLYQQLADKCQEYVNAKGTFPSSNYGIARLETARQMRDYSRERIRILQDPMNASEKRLAESKRAVESRHNIIEVLSHAKDVSTEYQAIQQVSLSNFRDSLATMICEMKARERYTTTQNARAFEEWNSIDSAEAIKQLPHFNAFANHILAIANISDYSHEQIYSIFQEEKVNYERQVVSQMATVPGNGSTVEGQSVAITQMNRRMDYN